MNKLTSIILSLFIVLIMTGCGNTEKPDSKDDNTVKDKTENTEKPGDNGNSSGDEKGEDKGDGESGDKNTNANDIGMTPGLPADFPSDVPEPPDSKVIGSLNSSEGTVVTFESNEKVKEIVDFYKDEMKKNGFDLSDGGEILITDDGGLIGWKKGSRELGLMLAHDKDKDMTSTVITYK